MKVPVRPCIRRLHAYTPGEQPRIRGLIKLNTNENPYPPSPRVVAAIRRELTPRLRLYPDPNSDRFRARVAKAYGFRMEQVIAGNGSDDILAMCLRAFVGEGDLVQFPRPTYSLYPVLARIQDGRIREIPFTRGFLLDPSAFSPEARLTFVAHPNAPTGAPIPIKTLAALARRLKGALVIDEAYADFASHNALALAKRLPNVLVSRTLSKSFSLAGMRLGFAVGSRALVDELFKVKDSYNLDRLAQAAGDAALADMPHHRRCVARVIRTRERFRGELERRGWRVLPSEANFVFARPPCGTAAGWLQDLRSRRILVRWFAAPDTRDHLRITIGRDGEMAAFLKAADGIAKARR